MKTARTMLPLVVVMALAGTVLADWNPGDPYKMHYPQLPDSTGWDVNFAFPNVLADDWRCSESGPVKDIHFWFSSHQDIPFEVLTIHASIHADIPAGTGGIQHSRPGNLLWERDFYIDDFSIWHWGDGDQGYYDPRVPEYTKHDHSSIYQANIVDIEDPFYQVQDTIYWLDLSVTAVPEAGGFVDPILGWKTSLDHWNDMAVWDAGGAWQPLRDPETLGPLDLAFVITPEPASVCFLLAGGALLWRRRHR